MYYHDFDDEYFKEEDPRDDLIYECKEYIKDIVRQLYSNDPLNVEDLSFSLEEVCHLLSIDLPKPDLNVARKEKSAKESFFSALNTLSLYASNKTKILTQ